MKPFEERFTAWVDGQLTGSELAEFEKELATHPEAAAEREGARKLGNLLRTQPLPPLGNEDFFNHQLMERIAAETPRASEPAKARGWFWSMPRLAMAGAACLLIAAGLYQAFIPPSVPVGEKSKYYAQVIESWPGDPSISAVTVYNPEDNVTVVWLDGLDYIPSTYALN
jgi:anti-sigma factor RsiW